MREGAELMLTCWLEDELFLKFKSFRRRISKKSPAQAQT